MLISRLVHRSLISLRCRCHGELAGPPALPFFSK